MSAAPRRIYQHQVFGAWLVTKSLVRGWSPRRPESFSFKAPPRHPTTLAALQAASDEFCNSYLMSLASLSAESLQAAEEPLPALQAASVFARFAALQAGGAGGGPAGPLRFKYNARCKLASDALAGISPTQHCAHPSSHGCSSSLSNGNVLPALFSERA